MTPEQLAAIERAKSRIATPQSGLSPEQLAAIDRARNMAAQSQQATPTPAVPPAQGGQPPDGFVLNPDTGQMIDVQSPNNPFVREGMGISAAQGAGQGVSFGTMDELVGGIAGLKPGPGSFGEKRDFESAMMREELRRAREQNPITAIGSEVAGGAASALAGGVAAGATKLGQAAIRQAGSGMGGRMGLGAVAGSVEGGLYGAGSADPGERAQGAGMGAGIGAGVGAVGVPLLSGAGAVMSPVGRTIARRTGMNNTARAQRAIAKPMQDAGVSEDQLRRYLSEAQVDGQSNFTIADAIGHEGQRALSGIARQPGQGRQAIVESLEARQAGQGGRVADALSEALGVRRTSEAARGQMTGERGAVANARYSAARNDAGPVDVRGAVGVIDSRIGGMQGSGVTGDGIDARLAGYRQRLSAPESALEDGVNSRTLSDFDRVLGVKQALQDDIGAAVRAGRNNEARELGKLLSELDGSLEASSPGYRAANDGFRADSQAIDQLDAGQTAAGGTVRSADVVSGYNALPPSPRSSGPGAGLDARDAYRTGYGNSLAARLEGQVDGGDSTRFFRNDKSRAIIEAMSDDPELFQRRMGREATMYETRRQATQGSLTANNQADNAAMEGADLGVVVDAVADAGNFQLGNIIRRVARSVGGENETTKKKIAEMLMSGDPSILSAVQGRIGGDGLKRQIMEALARTSATRSGIAASR